jgi:predicted  nucleic acid-binding Zn-ribbon protein
MERLTAKKKLAVVRLYFSGLPYDEIAAKCGVSKGTVANLVAELKAGTVPEAADVGEHIELLRELSIDLKQSKLNPAQCAIGLIFLTRINECGLEPADIDRWPMILKAVRNEDDAKEFIRLIYSIQEVQKRSGLGIEAQDKKVHELEKKAADLETVSDKLKDAKKELADLSKQRDELTNSVAMLQQRSELLIPQVKEMERRERNLSRRIADMEPKAEKAETTLSAMKREMQKLEDLGLSLKGLAELNERLQEISQRHAIKSSELRTRLLHELRALDKGLALETTNRRRQQELDKAEQALARTKKEVEAAKAVVGTLEQEKTNLEASIREMREKVMQEIANMVPLARDTVDKLGEGLRRGSDEALAEMRRLRDEALNVGREVGRYEGTLKSCEWLDDLLALVRGEEGIAGKRVRAIVLLVVRGLRAWVKGQGFSSDALLPRATELLIGELERWKV